MADSTTAIEAVHPAARLLEPVELPCGLVVPNRLVKAALAEAMAPSHNPDDKFLRAYTQWAEGGWGMILTGNVMVSNKHHGNMYDIEVNHKEKESAALQMQWKQWARACRSKGAAAIVQLNHPGRQSPIGSGRRWFWEKSIAPSAVGISLGQGWLYWFISSLVFGTPRAMSTDEIYDTIEEFTASAKAAYDAGFSGVQIHGAHGYLIAQFLSATTNLRTDMFGGTPAKRAEFVIRLIRRIRAATSPSFCIGIKLNSADHQTNPNPEDVIEQIKLIIDEGIDFIEISGGSYENPLMFQAAPSEKSESTAKREAFFLDFAHQVRERFPTVKLMVTGGFRTRAGMRDAIESGDCDLIGVGRPSCVLPKLPIEQIFNPEVKDDQASFWLKKAPAPPGTATSKALQAGAETQFYSAQINRLGKGLVPLFA